MNLVDFQNKISSDVYDDSLFSKSITLCNLLNGNFHDEEIISVDVSKEDEMFHVKTLNEYSADRLVAYDGNIVAGAYEPLYKLSISRESCSLKIKLINF